MITITHSEHTYNLPRDFITKSLRRSVLASTLEMDPEATQINLTHPSVTPKVMNLLVDLSQGKEPRRSDATLRAGFHYLNLPRFYIYASPSYDLLPDNVDPNSPYNRSWVRKAIRGDKLGAYRYLFQKGLQVRPGDVSLAATSGSLEIFSRIFARRLKLGPRGWFRALLGAVRGGHNKLVDICLEQPFVPKQIFHALTVAVRGGHLKIVQQLLPRCPVNVFRLSMLMGIAARHNHVEILKFLLTLANEDTWRGSRRIMSLRHAISSGKLDTVRVLLDYHRPHLSMINYGRFLDLATQQPEPPQEVIIELLERHFPTLLETPGGVMTNVYLQMMAERGLVDVVDFILRNDDEIPYVYSLALNVAITGGHHTVVARLLAEPCVTGKMITDDIIKAAWDLGHHQTTSLLQTHPKTPSCPLTLAQERALQARLDLVGDL